MDKENVYRVREVPQSTRDKINAIAGLLGLTNGQVLTMAANLLWDDVKVPGHKLTPIHDYGEYDHGMEIKFSLKAGQELPDGTVLDKNTTFVGNVRGEK